MALTPQQVAANWSQGMAGATEKIRRGVEAVTESPTEKAVAAIPRMVQGIQMAAANGRIQDGLRRVTLDDWKQSMLQKGVGRVASGAAAAQSKFTHFMEEFLPFVQAGRDKLNREMPRGNTEQNIQRAVMMMRHNAQFKRSR